VGEMSPALQAKLLRVLETHEIERVGATARLKVDVRVLAATNRDLEAAVKQGTFRADLFYRLNVVALRLPPLRERREDIGLLASYFAARTAAKVKRPLVAITPEARACLQRYEWPGNVRELQNAIEHAVVLGSGELLRPEDLPEHVLDVPAPATEDEGGAYHTALHATKVRLIRQAVERADGSIVQAAALLGLHPNYLHRLMRNLGLKGAGPR
jgi:transcriptional regulator with GAF, ATPase, and Fis domain